MLNKEHPNIAAMRAGKAALDDMLRRGTATDAEIDTAKKGLEETERYVQQKAVAGNRNIIAKLNALGGPYDNNYDNEDDWDGDRDNIASEKAAIQASCETRLLVGQQAAAFTAAALPLSRRV